MSTRSTRNRANRRTAAERPLYRVGGSAGKHSGKSAGNSSIPRKRTPAPPRDARKKRLTKLLGVILAVFLCLVLAGSIAGAITGPSRIVCRQIIHKFETACNELDVSGITDCMKPSLTNNLVKLGTAAVGEDTLNLILGLLGSGLDAIDAETDIRTLFQTIQLEPKQYGLPGELRCVKCKATFAGMVQYVNIYITKVSGDVYITKLEFTDI